MNLTLLNSIIEESGLKKKYIADQLGITKQGLSNKLCGKREFKSSEINAICKVLNIKAGDRDKIFFS